MYNIVLKENKSFVLASCKTLKQGKSYLENMKKLDKHLFKVYHWKRLPQYEIIKV